MEVPASRNYGSPVPTVYSRDPVIFWTTVRLPKRKAPAELGGTAGTLHGSPVGRDPTKAMVGVGSAFKRPSCLTSCFATSREDIPLTELPAYECLL